MKAGIGAICGLSNKQQKEEKRPDLVDLGTIQIDTRSRRVFRGEKEINLTAKEYDLFELLMNHPNQIYNRDQLLHAIWGAAYPGDARTVDVHIRRLREKVETNPSEPEFIHTKWGVGYFFKN